MASMEFFSRFRKTCFNLSLSPSIITGSLPGLKSIRSYKGLVRVFNSAFQEFQFSIFCMKMPVHFLFT